ncbi:MAG: hypothetical protein Q9220_007424 [cf. Caloplaca sp. 1 TL-2023]
MEPSSQRDPGIAFNLDVEHSSFRLLELPSSLLNIITSDNPPSLCLKSTAPSDANLGPAVLCSDDHTFYLRQVHSSNSIFILQPSTSKSDSQASPESHAVTAISRCDATLEAIPYSPSTLQLLKEGLPILNASEEDNLLTSHQKRSRQSISNDIPVSIQEFEQAWNDLCAVEIEGVAWLPSPSLLWKTWKSIIAACSLESWALDAGVNIELLRHAVEEDDIPTPVFNAVISRLQVNQGNKTPLSVLIDPLKCVQWTGVILLEYRTNAAHGLAVEDFIREWKDHLPEVWRRRATLALLEGHYVQPSKETVMYDGSDLLAEKNTAAVAQAKAIGPNARKWHERFKNTRR